MCLEKSQEAARASFDSALTVARLVLTRAPQYFLPFWYAKEPMFWLPHGWFPYYAEWILSFPRAPVGSVSIASWQLACTGVIALFSDLITGILGLIATKRKETPVASGPKRSSEKSNDKTAEQKKEL